MSKFQIILLVIFGFFTFAAVALFALYKGSSSQVARVTLWGTFPSEDVNRVLTETGLTQDSTLSISYVEKPSDSIETELTEALAQGEGPDLILLEQGSLVKNKSKLVVIPYASVGERDFVDTFAESGETYLRQDGVYGLPILIDPLILYYNRDLLTAAGISKPIAFWDEVYVQTTDLSKRDAAGNLSKSAVALGEVKNIKNSKDILSLLLLQAGTPIVAYEGGMLRSYLNDTMGLPTLPSNAALEFYTQFANPTKAFYSWNRALPEAQARFASGDLAYYLGFASEYRAIRNKNPLLNFAVAAVPQSRVASRTLTTGKVYGLSITRGARNPSAAFSVALRLVSPSVAQSMANVTALAPARRDLLSARPTDTILPVFYSSALQAKVWSDPDPVETRRIFADMAESVTSGRARVTEAIRNADEILRNLIGN